MTLTTAELACIVQSALEQVLRLRGAANDSDRPEDVPRTCSEEQKEKTSEDEESEDCSEDCPVGIKDGKRTQLEGDIQVPPGVEDWGKHIIKYGRKHKGLTYQAVYDNDTKYTTWIIQHAKALVQRTCLLTGDYFAGKNICAPCV